VSLRGIGGSRLCSGIGELRDRVGGTWNHSPAKRQAKSSVLLTIRTRYFHAAAYRKTSIMTTKVGIKTQALKSMYPKKLGIFTPECSAIDLTMKFGPLPM